MSVKSRIGELNARLATKLTARGVTASEDETTTALINKVDDIPEGGGIDWSQFKDWRYFSCYNNRNDLVAKLKYSDTANGWNFSNMLQSCSSLTTIPLLNMSSMSGTSWGNMFYGCKVLENVTFEGTIPVRGNMSVFSSCPNLTVESLMSFINALTNMSSSSTYTITIGSTNLAKLTEEQIQIATDKRITLQ